MPRFKMPDYGLKLIPVDFAQQVLPGTFEFALCHLVDHELDLSTLRSRYTNDAGGAPAFDPAVLLVCDRQGLIGRELFAIDGVKLPSNAAKHKSGTRGAKGAVRLSNRTDNDSAKMATGKGVIQGYTDVAAVDAAHQNANTDFNEADDRSHCLCPAGKRLYRNGGECTINGYAATKYSGAERDCVPCAKRH